MVFVTRGIGQTAGSIRGRWDEGEIYSSNFHLKIISLFRHSSKYQINKSDLFATDCLRKRAHLILQNIWSVSLSQMSFGNSLHPRPTCLF